MGIVYTPIKVRNPNLDEPATEMQARLDTEATLPVLPAELVKQYRFVLIRRQTVKYANEDTAERDVVGMVEVEICGRKGWFEAIVEPRKTYPLVGAVVMESLDLIVEPRGLGVYPNPRSVQPMAEVE
ncbi:MAG: hypothetical protein NTW87_08035 [Planctomycetota bacterium]|nr:hypothetical protein [Planctomycetota bacterium]